MSATPSSDAKVPARPSGRALLALLLALLGVPLIPALLGYWALVDIRESGGKLRGRPSAVLSVVLGTFWFVAAGAGVFFSARPELLMPRLFPADFARRHAAAADGMQRIWAQQQRSRSDDLDGNGVRDFWADDVSGMYRHAMARFGHPDIVGIDLARADEEPWSDAHGEFEPRDGYVFRSLPGVDRRTQFAFSGRPHRFGIDGVYSYYVDERGQTWMKDNEGQPAPGRMEDPAAAGWSKVNPR